MPQENLKEVFDRITRQVTKDTIGIQLVEGDASPGEDLCTVHIGFQRGFRSSLSLRANKAMLRRLTQSLMMEENVSLQDMEDATKEYFNVLCGQIAAALFQATRIAARFGVPSFHHGHYSPENQEEQFVLSYSSDQNESAQLIHHIPSPPREDGADGAGQNGS